MSFKKLITRNVNVTSDDGALIESSTREVETTFEVKSLEITNEGVMAYLFCGSSTISEGALEGELVWSFFGKYPITIDTSSGDSPLEQAEAQISKLFS